MPFVSDSFTDTAGTTLASHTGETGATWTKHASSGTGTIVISDANRARYDSPGNNVALYYASGLPASADYSVQGLIRLVTDAADIAGICGRMSTSVLDFYIVEHVSDSWRLRKFVGGTPTTLGTWAETLGAGAERTAKLEMIGTAIKVYVNGTERISVTDSAISASGRAGLRFFHSVAGSNSTLQHLDDFDASDPATAGQPTGRRFALMEFGRESVAVGGKSPVFLSGVHTMRKAA